MTIHSSKEKLLFRTLKYKVRIWKLNLNILIFFIKRPIKCEISVSKYYETKFLIFEIKF